MGLIEIDHLKLLSEDEVTTVNLKESEDKQNNFESCQQKPDGDDYDELRYALHGLCNKDDVLAYSTGRFLLPINTTVFIVRLEPKEYLRSLQARLKTFECYQSEVMISVQLAEAGFISLGDRDAVGCVWCFLLVKNFKEYVNPTIIHQMYSHGKCEYLNWLDAMEQNPNSALLHQYDLDCELFPLTKTSSLSTTVRTAQQKGLELPATDQLSKVDKYQQFMSARYELYRLQTFLNCPFFTGGSANLLAREGMLWRDGQITCIYCAWSWDMAGDPQPTATEIVSNHLKSNNQGVCGLTKDETLWSEDLRLQNDADSSSRTSLGINTSCAKFPEFAVMDRRRATFLTYPSGKGQPDHYMADAGYFYSGKGDSVTCFFCGIESAHWNVNEDPWQRHARSSTDCPFLRAEKKPSFISQSIAQNGAYKFNPTHQESKIISVTTRMLRPRMDSVVVQNCLKAGMNRDQVRFAVLKRIQEGKMDFTCTADVMKAILELEVPGMVQVRQLQLPEVSIIPAADRSSPVNVNQIQPEGNDGQIFAEELLQRDPLAFLQTPEVFRTIAAQLTCKICMSTPVGIVFLPCGHFVCCIACAAAVVQCPICRKNITATVKANFVHQPESTLSPTVSKLMALEQPCDDDDPQNVTEDDPEHVGSNENDES